MGIGVGEGMGNMAGTNFVLNVGPSTGEGNGLATGDGIDPDIEASPRNLRPQKNSSSGNSSTSNTKTFFFPATETTRRMRRTNKVLCIAIIAVWLR